MRLFERLVYKHELSGELSNICRDFIDLDQFAYREGHNSTMALIKYQHKWLSWLDGGANFVNVFFLYILANCIRFSTASHSLQ